MRKDIALMKRQRVMDYFINATIDIVSESGIDSVTLRSVAEKAGYNSATLYNYFESIDQLIAFAIIRTLDDYFISLDKILRDDNLDSLQKYIRGWDNFVRHSLEKPDFFYLAYFEHSDIVFANFNQYIEYYPEEIGSLSESFMTMNSKLNIEDQDRYMLEDCVKNGFFKEENIDEIISGVKLLYLGILSKARLEPDEKKADIRAEYFMKYARQILEKYLQVKIKIL